MITTILISALATGAYAWTYPDCERDGCYRNLVGHRYSGEAPAFCIGWISGTTTDAGAIPTQYRNCPGVAPLSSVCSCIAYTATMTDCTAETAASTLSPVTTSSQSQMIAPTPPVTTISESTTECATETEASTSPLMTTSTIQISTTAYHFSSNEVSTMATSSPVESSSVSVQPHPLTTPPPPPPPPPQSSTQAPLPQSSGEVPPQSSYVTEILLLQSSTQASHPSPQSSGCRYGKRTGPNGDCSPITSPPPQHLPLSLATVSGSSTAPVVTAGASRLRIEAAIVVVGLAAALC